MRATKLRRGRNGFGRCCLAPMALMMVPLRKMEVRGRQASGRIGRRSSVRVLLAPPLLLVLRLRCQLRCGDSARACALIRRAVSTIGSEETL